MVQNRKKTQTHLIIHSPTSSGVSDVSERAIERAVRSKRTSERYERTDERVAQYLHLNFFYYSGSQWIDIYSHEHYSPVGGIKKEVGIPVLPLNPLFVVQNSEILRRESARF